MIPAGFYQAKAISGEFGTSTKEKTDFVSVLFEIQGGEHAGQRLYWSGWFGEKSTTRTTESLTYCGCTFPDNDITNLTGLETNTVPVVVEHQQYTNDKGEAKVSAKIAWVNNPNGGGVSPEAAMDAAKKAAFAQRMRGTVATIKGKQSANGATQSAPAAAPGASAPF